MINKCWEFARETLFKQSDLLKQQRGLFFWLNEEIDYQKYAKKYIWNINKELIKDKTIEKYIKKINSFDKNLNEIKVEFKINKDFSTDEKSFKNFLKNNENNITKLENKLLAIIKIDKPEEYSWYNRFRFYIECIELRIHELSSEKITEKESAKNRLKLRNILNPNTQTIPSNPPNSNSE